MGQGGSSEFKASFQTTISHLSELELADIGAKYNELYKHAGGRRGRVIDREGFSKYFNLPVALGDRLFEAFDVKKNNAVDFEEFLCGFAILTNGSFSDKCRLLFHLFNLAGDEGISKEELQSMLSAVVNSTSTILLTVTEGGGPMGRGGCPIANPEPAIKNVVDTAFKHCDISQSGKLLPLEFEYWIKRNPKVLDLLLPSIDPEQKNSPTLAPLLFVPMEDDVLVPRMKLSMDEEKDDETLDEVELENKDVVIDIEEEEEEEERDPGTVEPPSSPVTLLEEPEVNNDIDILNDEKEDEREEEKVEVKEEEVKNEDEEEREDEEKIDESKDELKDEGNGTESPEVQEETKQRSISSVSASEETIQLARQLSECLTSPVANDNPILALDNEEDNVLEIDEKILSSWIPNASVQSMLAIGRKVPLEYLTQPGLIAQTGKCDPIAEVLSSTFPGSERRHQVSVEQVKMDEEGLQILLCNGSYHSALSLTGLFLSAHGQGMGQAGQMTMHTHKTVQMWSVRLQLLCHLERYAEVNQEMEAFKDLDQPDLYYQYNKHNYPGLVGTMVPFTMRLIHALLPLHLNNLQLALNRTCYLQHTTLQILRLVRKGQLPFNKQGLTPEEQKIAEEVWLNRLIRVKCALCRCLLAIGDYSLVREVLEEILTLDDKYETQVLSSLGRLCLLYGDLSSAEVYFSKISSLLEQDTPIVSTNKGLLAIYRNQYGIAEQNFHSSNLNEPSTVSINNVAISAFYQQRLSEAISQLEEHIKNSPIITTSLFKSLVSCYELESSQAQAKKLSWVPFLGLHAPEGLNITSLGLIT